MKKFLIPLSLVLLIATVPLLGSGGPPMPKPVLTISGTGAPGETLDIDVVGAVPDTDIGIFGSIKKECTTYSTPWGDIHMCIGPHLFLVTSGTTDSLGEFTGQIVVPNYPPHASGATIWFQGLQAVVKPGGVRFMNTTVDSIVLK